jgi:hypothetical protein
MSREGEGFWRREVTRRRNRRRGSIGMAAGPECLDHHRVKVRQWSMKVQVNLEA